jgi:hypothetical protein
VACLQLGPDTMKEDKTLTQSHHDSCLRGMTQHYAAALLHHAEHSNGCCVTMSTVIGTASQAYIPWTAHT